MKSENLEALRLKGKSKNKNVLGRGLNSLFSQEMNPKEPQKTPPIPEVGTDEAKIPTKMSDNGVSTPNKDKVPGLTMVPVEQIVPNIYQPRRSFSETEIAELAESIKQNGIIQPLVVRRSPKGGYMLIAGERRLRAARSAGLQQVPVVLRKSTDKEALQIAVIENVQRQDLNCVDIALAYFQLIEDFSLTQQEVADQVGKDRATVANHLRLLKLPEEVLTALKEAKLTFGHGKALLALPDTVQRLKVMNEILEENLSVRATERLVSDLLAGGSTSGTIAREKKKNDTFDSLSTKLGRILGSKVSFKGSEKRGKIVINYYSREDLDRIIEQLES